MSSAFFTAAEDMLSFLLLTGPIFGQSPLDRKVSMFTGTRSMRYKQADLDKADQIVKELRQGTLLVEQALQRFIDLSCVKAFMERWDEEMHFHQHCKKYFAALKPDSGIAFHETDRYTKPPKSASVRQTPSPTPPPASKFDTASLIDVAVFATRAFKKGEQVVLKGRVADLTEEEDDRLRLGGERPRDFSVLWSDRKQCFGLLLGPARFVNHDCRNNVIFDLKAATMTFKVVEDIEPNEQIFTHYGDHYFEMNNASCLCCTCEQHKRGAFSPAAKANASKPKPAILSPSRRSARKSAPPGMGLSFAGAGHELTAQRSLSRPSRASSLSSPAGSLSSNRGKKGRDDVEKRRSERNVVVVDELRTKKRTVHPKLPPPPGYSEDYMWDERKKAMKYVGPNTAVSTRDRDRSSTPLTITKTIISKVALGKRKRADSDTDSDGKPRRRHSMPSLHAAKRAEAFAKKVKALKLGTRTSGRTGGGIGATATALAFKRLEQNLGVDLDESLSDLDSSQVSSTSGTLTELESSAKEEEDEKIAEEEEEENEVVERYLVTGLSPDGAKSIESTFDAGDEGDDEGGEQTPSRQTSAVSSFCMAKPPPLPPGCADYHRDLGDEDHKDSKLPPSPPLSRGRPSPPSLDDSEADDELEDDIILIPTPAFAASSFSRTRLSLRRRPFHSQSRPVDASDNTTAPAQSSRHGSTNQSNGTTVTIGDLVGVIPSRAGSSRSGGGKDGDDDDDEDKKRKGKSNGKDEHSAMPSKKAKKAEEEDEKPTIPLVPIPQPPMSESGDVSLSGRDEIDQEAAQLLMLMMTGGGDKSPAAGPSNSGPPSAANSNDVPFLTTSTPTAENANPASPRPRTSASPEASATNPASLASAIVLQQKRKYTKRGRASDSTGESTPAPSLRTSRRTSQIGSFRDLHDPPLPVDQKPAKKPTVPATLSARPKTKTPVPPSPEAKRTPAVEPQARTAAKPSQLQRKRSGSRNSPLASPKSGTEEVRSTRRTLVLPGDIRSLIDSPDVMAVSGGYDEKTGRYRPASGKRQKSPSPEPVVLPEARSTRLSQPIVADLKDLIASPLVASVAGGYDPASGRYYSRKEGNRRVSGSPSGRGSGNESSPGPSRLRQAV